MPRNVRNAWVDVAIDGRKSRLRGGPRARNGCMRATVYVRDRGAPADALTVWAGSGGDGRPVVTTVDLAGNWTFIGNDGTTVYLPPGHLRLETPR